MQKKASEGAGGKRKQQDRFAVGSYSSDDERERESALFFSPLADEIIN